jgi:hypothetical protein
MLCQRAATITAIAATAVAWIAPARADDRPYVMVVDGAGPSEPEVEAMYGLSVGARGSGAVRLVDPTLGRNGVVQQLGAQAAAAPWIALGAYGLLSAANESDDPVTATAGGYAHFTVARPDPLSREGGSFGIIPGMHRELEGVIAATLTLAGGWKFGRFEAGGNLLLERRFTSDADPLDVIVRLAVAQAVLPELRLGLEYVGQDLEDAVEDEEAEGGAVHVLAASASLWLMDGDLQIGLAPGIAFTADDIGLVVRLVASHRF